MLYAYRLNGGALLKQSTVLPWITSGLGLGVLSINGGKKAKIFFFPQFFVKNSTLRGRKLEKTFSRAAAAEKLKLKH